MIVDSKSFFCQDRTILFVYGDIIYNKLSYEINFMSFNYFTWFLDLDIKFDFRKDVDHTPNFRFYLNIFGLENEFNLYNPNHSEENY